MNLLVKRLSPSARLPVRADEGSAGYDLYSATDFCIPAWTRRIIETHISIELPPGCYGRIAPRSGLACKCVDVCAGVIDKSYRGQVMVLLMNSSDQEYQGKTGDRIAQLILEQILLVEVKEVDTLSETQRGAGGFGSSGK